MERIKWLAEWGGEAGKNGMGAGTIVGKRGVWVRQDPGSRSEQFDREDVRRSGQGRVWTSYSHDKESTKWSGYRTFSDGWPLVS